MNRRAALQMSIQSIITFILAFIVMGALIGVITVIIDQIEVGVERLDTGDIPNPATAAEPVKIENGGLTIDRREEKSVMFSFYNNRYIVDTESAGGSCSPDATTICGWTALDFEITGCVGGVTPMTPTIQADYVPDIGERLQQGDVAGFETILTEPNNNPGKYTCTLQVNAIHAGGGASPASPTPLARNQFIMEVR